MTLPWILIALFASIGTATMLYVVLRIEQADDETRKKWGHGPKGQGR